MIVVLSNVRYKTLNQEILSKNNKTIATKYTIKYTKYTTSKQDKFAKYTCQK